MPDYTSSPRTTADSMAEGRMKVDCPHGRKKCLKCAMKHDGAGGPGSVGFLKNASYGKPPKGMLTIPVAPSSSTLKSTKKKTSLKSSSRLKSVLGSLKAGKVRFSGKPAKSPFKKII